MSSLEESLLESFLPGEVEQLAIDVVHHLPDPVSVQLKFSNFKIWTVGSFEVSYSLGSVERCEIQKGTASNFLTIFFRDKHLERFEYPAEKQDQVQHNFLELLFPRNKSNLFAFRYCESKFGEKGDPSWNLFSLEKEFQKRMGISEQWVLETQINKNYVMSRVYPKSFYLPRNCSTTDLWRVSICRGNGRVPLLCWYSPNAVICRAALPSPLLLKKMLFMKEVPHEPDQRILNRISAASKTFCFINLVHREGDTYSQNVQNCDTFSPVIAPMTEISQYYEEFHQICATSTTNNNVREKMVESRWVQSVNKLLELSNQFAKLVLEQNKSLLIASPEGDDVCAQISSLIQLMIDPYYRTIRGFGVLVEKEWMYFGHKFSDFTKQKGGFFSSIFGESDLKMFDSSWILFLDSVFQLLSAFPQFFEFNESLLTFIVNQTFSCRFGNFLFSCEKERQNAIERTASIWGHILENKGEFENLTYKPNEPFPLEKTVGVKLWDSVYLRSTPPVSCAKEND